LPGVFLLGASVAAPRRFPFLWPVVLENRAHLGEFCPRPEVLLEPQATPSETFIIMLHDLIIGMAGSGGDGIVSAGESLISASAK